jgi:GT2 family glycosyltransferase
LIVIVNYKTAQLTVNCLRSLEPEIASLPGAHVTVVENGSGDGPSLEAAIRREGWDSWVTLDVSETNGGFAYGNNRAIRPALASANPPDPILRLNTDTEIFPGAVRALVDFMEAHPEVGIAGSSFENADGSDWPIAFRFPSVWSEFEEGIRLGPVSRLLNKHVVARRMEKVEASIDWVAGASMIIRRAVFNAIGLLDESYFLYYEETDFCLRARRAGWPCWYVPQSHLMHIAGQATGVSIRQGRPARRPAYWFESRRRYFVKNFGLAYALAADLAFGLGYTLWRIRRFLQRKPDTDPPHLLSDFWKHSVLWRRNRVGPAREHS